MVCPVRGTKASKLLIRCSPSITEAEFLRLELRGLGEDSQGIQKGALLKEALALVTQRIVNPACNPSPAASMN